jgi:hypothetical protein
MTRALLIALCTLLLPACVSVKLPPAQPVIENISALRDAGIEKVSVGNFTLAAGAPQSINKSASARGSPISVEGGGTFTDYLRKTLISDLTAAGKYDASGATSIAGELGENTLHAAGVKRADALLAVRFTVMRDGQKSYDKLLRQAAEWQSSFVGAVAIPDAINHFGEQFRLILLQLYRDQEFQRAVRK